MGTLRRDIEDPLDGDVGTLKEHIEDPLGVGVEETLVGGIADMSTDGGGAAAGEPFKRGSEKYDSHILLRCAKGV